MRVQGLVCQELPTRVKGHKEKSEKKRERPRSSIKKKSFSQVEMIVMCGMKDESRGTFVV